MTACQLHKVVFIDSSKTPLIVHSRVLVVQAMGENVLGAVLELGNSLAEGTHKTCTERKLIFFDFLGLIMVRHSHGLLADGVGRDSKFSRTLLVIEVAGAQGLEACV